MGSKRVAKWVLVCATAIMLVLGARYVFLRLTGIITPDACISEDLKTIPDLSGLRFEIEYTNCDTLPKDEAVSVYVATAAKGKSWGAELVQSPDSDI